MQEALISSIKIALISLKIEAPEKITIERPTDMLHGDFSTNISLVLTKQLKLNPVNLALQIVETLKLQNIAGIEKIEVAGPGFINFYQTANTIKGGIAEILSNENFGKSIRNVGKKFAFEYTDPNPFKQFHIGHLMANTIGESLSRLGEYTGAEVKRFCYQGDVGRHVALALWGLRFMDKPFPVEDASLGDKVEFFGQAYAKGAQRFGKLETIAKAPESSESEKEEFASVEVEVREMNKKIYDRSDAEVNEIYDKGREWSLEQFEELYKILDTKFDRYFFESQMSTPGLEIVRANTAPKGLKLFRESDGAVIFPGEEYTDRNGIPLHTRVFITRDSLPTYDGKEIGFAKEKYAVYQYDKGITVSGNEQNDYFKVILKLTELLFPEIGIKAEHVSHGMLRLPTGKMSSRTGEVVTGESLLNDMRQMALERMKDREMSSDDKKVVADQVGVAAIKYAVLRQSSGKDIIFDAEKSLSFEGDSGPYLQYSAVRAKSLLEKAGVVGIQASTEIDWTPELEAGTLLWPGGKLERLLVRFPEVAARAESEHSPHHVANYLMELAGEFNSFYSSTQIVSKDDKFAPYKVALVSAFVRVITGGLWLLGIQVPKKM
ncbi:MAG: arginine--tRNA ligase [Patescibacteria group bacterium]